ncbi:hypothetical protein CK203_052700 [Vitis vinifera]|uniref:Uncharacterized protein n=1 Tax=Vitis vinifera TaxID=29760 RepID=A0A438GCN4_VITVI|nr:hypothetical protein CK203_052700 [Vitis vinifera]
MKPQGSFVSHFKLLCFILHFPAKNDARLFFILVFPQATAYYYHGLILDEGNTEKSHGMAVAALQAADEYLKKVRGHVRPSTWLLLCQGNVIFFSLMSAVFDVIS